MKRYLIISLLALLTSACSTKSKNSEAEVSEYSQSEPEAIATIGEPAAELKPEAKVEVKKASTEGAANLHGPLSEAIRSQNDEAIYRLATQILSQNPNDLRAQNSLGVYHYKKGRYLAAQYFFSRALKQNQNLSDLHNNLGLVSLAQKERRQAILSFKKAIELDSGNAAASANIASLYLQNKDYAKALVPLEIALKKSPKDYRLLTNYGLSLAGQSKFSQAKDQYNNALAVNSSGREAIFNLAVLQIEQFKNFQEGLDLLNKLKFLGPLEATRGKINTLENVARAGLK